MDANVIVIGSMGIVGMLIVAVVGMARKKEADDASALAWELMRRYDQVVERHIQLVEKAMAVVTAVRPDVEPRLAMGLAQTLTRPGPLVYNASVKEEQPVRTEPVSGVTVRAGRTE